MTLKIAAPESVGLSSQRLARIRPVMQQYVNQEQLCGLTTMIWRNGVVAHLEKFGQQDDTEPNSVRHHFPYLFYDQADY